jgi:hypothetical protein
MRVKLSSFLFGVSTIIALIAFVGCHKSDDNNNNPPAPEHVNNEFKFVNIATNYTSISLDVSPVDKNMEYVVLMSEMKHFMMNRIDTREELLEDDNNYLYSLAQQYNITIYDFLSTMRWLVKGDKEGYKVVNLYPDTEYVFYCYGVEFDSDGNNYDVVTPVNYVVVRTSAPEMIDVEFGFEGSVDGSTISLNITPNNYDGLYYSYIVSDTDRYFIPADMTITDEYVEYYRNRAFVEFNELINNQGIAAEQFCHKGEVALNKRLHPNRGYQVVVFAVSDDQTPILCSIPTLYNFTTEGVDMSDLTIDLQVTDITPYTAQLTVTPSNNKESYACVFLSKTQVPPYDDEYEVVMDIIENYQPAIFTGGWSEQLMPLMPNTEYCVLAFGIDNNIPTTELFRYDFTSAAAAEGKVKIESIDIVKLFDAQDIVALDSSYANALAECECVAVVEMKTSVPTDKIYFWWYESWMKMEYSEEAFLEDLLLYDYSTNPEIMDMYYSIAEDDMFFFAGIAEDDEGNMSPIYYGDMFVLSKEQCDPAEEFFDYVATRSTNRFIFAR